jgi:hypothetical protein
MRGYDHLVISLTLFIIGMAGVLYNQFKNKP